MNQAEMLEAKVGDVYAVLRREGLLDTCERVELAWPEGVCFHCRLVAGRRALGGRERAQLPRLATGT